MASKIFDEFSVTFHGGEAPIYDFEGNEYPYEGDGLILAGEKGYEFLAQLNAADKEWFNQRMLGYLERQRVFFDVTLPENDPICDVCIELGNLDFLNAKSVSEALSIYLPQFYEHVFQQIHLRDKIQLSEEDCTNLMTKLKLGLALLKNEENIYLGKHPEVRQINETDINNSYVYAVPKIEFTQIRRKAPKVVLRSRNSAKDEALSIILPTEIQPCDGKTPHPPVNYLDTIDFSNIEQYPMVLLPNEELAVFESSYSTSAIALLNHQVFEDSLHIRPIITEREISAFHLLNKSLSLQEGIAPFDSRKDDHVTMKWEEPSVVSWGFQAVQNFFKNHMGIDPVTGPYSYGGRPFLPAIRPYREANLLINKQSMLHVRYKEYPQKVYEALGRHCMPRLPYAIEQAVKRAWGVVAKYHEGQSFNPWIEDLPELRLPTIEQSRRALERAYERPITLRTTEDKSLANLFYDAYAACDMENDTPEKLCRAALLRMAEDGIPKATARSILKADSPHPDYYLDVADELLAKDKDVQAAFHNVRTQSTFCM